MRKNKISRTFIYDSFIKLTSNTYPYGYEDDIADEMIKCELFPKDIEKDKHGNYFYKIGESRTIFTSHLDTANRDAGSVQHVIDGNMIKTDGRSILGADDKAGVTIMSFMIKNNIPGLYYFFIGEEVGCVGSGLASKYGDFTGNYDRVVSFDRRGLTSVITYQSSTRCCSDKFAEELAFQLNKSGLKYEKDSSGIYTDSAEFVDVVPECTNLSVGYYSEHTVDERQDIEHLRLLADACLKVDWENLSTNRDMKKKEYKSYGGYNFGGGCGYGSSYNRHSGSWNTNSNNTSTWRDRDWSQTKSDYGVDDDFYDGEEEGRDGAWINGIWRKNDKKTRRGNKKKDSNITPGWKSLAKSARKFLDGGNGQLIEVDSDVDYSSHYDWVMTKFLDGEITPDELIIIKDQYLDMGVESDRKLYSNLVDFIGEYNK